MDFFMFRPWRVCHVGGNFSSIILIPHQKCPALPECQSTKTNTDDPYVVGYGPESLAGFTPESVAGFAQEYSAGGKYASER
jgi:hypothetical protein